MKFLSAPESPWQADLNKTKVHLDLLTYMDMLLMVEKGIRGGIYYSLYEYVKASNKYMKDNNKNKEMLYLQYWDVNNLYHWAMSQKLPKNSFEWIEYGSKFNEDVIKTILKKAVEDIFLKLMFNILKIYINYKIIYLFYQK